MHAGAPHASETRPPPDCHGPDRGMLEVAVIGTGIAGMAAAWLLSQRHRVTVYEQAGWIGGHSHTVDAPPLAGGAPVAVDTGFIVYNDATYPNLIALFAHLGVATQPSDMSFAFSARDGALEYGGGDLAALLADKRQLLRPRFWRMLADLLRFYARAPADAAALGDSLITLGEYLDRRAYSRAFQDDHLLPMAAAIWSCPHGAVRDAPAAAFLRFCENHGLLQLRNRPAWRTVAGGAREYVARLTAPYAQRILHGVAATGVRREGGDAKSAFADRSVMVASSDDNVMVASSDEYVMVASSDGQVRRFDHAVLACHADQALALLEAPDPREQALLGVFRYSSNLAVLHSDARLMPRRRAVWSSWNFLAGQDPAAPCCVTYWMNRLQGLDAAPPLFVTLNPPAGHDIEGVIRRDTYEHPLFDAAALRAQRDLWSLQGRRRTWFCGAYFGAGFHEDSLQAGLAVAEALGGVRRPWRVAAESGRIFLPEPADAGEMTRQAA